MMLLLLLLLLSPAFGLMVGYDGPFTAQPSGWDHVVESDLSFTYSAVVTAPPSMVIAGDPNNLEDGDVVCPSTPITVSASLSGSVANGRWHATFSAPAGECPNSESATVAPVPLDFSLSTFNDWSTRGEIFGSHISSSYELPLSVSVDTICGEPYERVLAAPTRAVVGPSLYIDIAGDRRVFSEGESFSHTSTVGEGQATVAIGGSLGIAVALLYTGPTPYTAYYSTDFGSGDVSLAEDSITLLATSPVAEAQVVSVEPSTIDSLPVTVRVVVRNTGNVPILFRSISTPPSMTAQPQEGFDEVIAVGQEAELSFTLSGTLPPTLEVTLEGEADRDYCGERPTLSLPLPLSRGKDGEARIVVRSSTGEEEFVGRGNVFYAAAGESVTVTYRICGQGSFTASYTALLSNGGEQRWEDSIAFSGQCQDVVVTTFVCDASRYTAYLGVEVEGDSNNNDEAVVGIYCQGSTVCTPQPEAHTLFPGFSFIATIYCGESTLCESVSATSPVPWLSFSANNAFLTITASPDAPMGSKATVDVRGESNGLSYSCTIDVSTASAECIDFI